MKSKNILLIFCLLLLIGCSRRNFYKSQEGDITIRVMAAASLTEVFTDIGKKYEEINPNIHLEFNFAGTQALVNQIEEGVKADIFASANLSYMEHLKEKELVTDPRIFASNKLIIGVFREVDGISGIDDLSTEGIKLAIADSSVPVGKYTLQLLEKIDRSKEFLPNFSQEFMQNVVSKELNVKSVVAKIELGEVDAGIVYKTDITGKNDKDIKTIEIDEQYNIKTEYPIALMVDSTQEKESKDFLGFIQSQEGKLILEEYGFVLN